AGPGLAVRRHRGRDRRRHAPVGRGRGRGRAAHPAARVRGPRRAAWSRHCPRLLEAGPSQFVNWVATCFRVSRGTVPWSSTYHAAGTAGWGRRRPAASEAERGAEPSFPTSTVVPPESPCGSPAVGPWRTMIVLGPFT